MIVTAAVVIPSARTRAGLTGDRRPLDEGRRASSRAKSPRAIAADYISVYDIQRAVEDRATVPIYYESRLAKIEPSFPSISTSPDSILPSP